MEDVHKRERKKETGKVVEVREGMLKVIAALWNSGPSTFYHLEI